MTKLTFGFTLFCFATAHVSERVKATVVPIGIEVWKAYHHEPVIEQTPAPPQ